MLRGFTEIDKFYPLKVWVAVTLFIAFFCACWPDVRMYPDTYAEDSFLWRLGFFMGVFALELQYSLHILICMYLVYYFLAYRFLLPAIIIKSAMFILFTISVFMAVHIFISGTWFHPFFIVSSALGAITFYMFNVYVIYWESVDWDTADWESGYGKSIDGE